MSIYTHILSLSLLVPLTGLALITAGCDTANGEDDDDEMNEDAPSPEGASGPAVADLPLEIGPGAPMVRLAKPTVEGALDSGIFLKIVRAHNNEVRYCYSKGLSRDPELAGRVIAEFEIDEDGAISEAPQITASVGDVEVDSCIADAIESWVFPVSADGEEVYVTMPFVLSLR